MSAAEHIRESILLLLAQNGSLTAAEIYGKIDTIETRQFLYAQINYLKKEGKILAEQGKTVADKGVGEPTHYKLAKPLKEIVADEAVKNGMWHLSVPDTQTEESIVPNEFVVDVRTVHRLVWEILDRKHTVSLELKNGMWHLTARRSSPVTPEMLRDMANMIESSDQ
jgi:hypothetical protein